MRIPVNSGLLGANEQYSLRQEEGGGDGATYKFSRGALFAYYTPTRHTACVTSGISFFPTLIRGAGLKFACFDLPPVENGCVNKGSMFLAQEI